MHNNGDRNGVLTLCALGVPAGDDIREGDGVCCLFMEDIIKASPLRCLPGIPRRRVSVNPNHNFAPHRQFTLALPF